MSWDPVAAAAFFDEYAGREWSRFEDGRTPAPSVATHVRMLERYVRSGDRVLDAGCGPGRFTLELKRIGADVVALDISPVQLDLLRGRVAGVETVLGDVTELAFGDASFDATVCFGGPISYAVDRSERAVAELARVTKPGGHLLVSVMSLAGALIHFVDGMFDFTRRNGVEASRAVVRTGMLPTAPTGHPAMRLFRAQELEQLLGAHGEVVALAAAGLAPARAPEEPELRNLLAELDAELCEEPGAVDAGHHIVGVVRIR